MQEVHLLVEKTRRKVSETLKVRPVSQAHSPGHGARPAEGQGGTGRAQGPGVRQSLRSRTQVLRAGTHSGSFWLLVGLVGAKGTAGLK